MKIAYVSIYDSSDVHAWSGLGNYIFRSLKNAGFQTERIGNLRARNIWVLLSYLKKIYYRYLLSQNYLRDREIKILLDYAAHVNKLLACIQYDILFSPGTNPFGILQIEKPIAFWTDSTFAGMIDFYPAYTNLCAETINNGNKMEQSALSQCRLAIYASEWAARTAIQYYDIDPEKVKVVPFGANIECGRNLDDIIRITECKRFDICKLLFLGVDWYRKGGDKALAIANSLNQRGIKTELHIAGCRQPAGLPNFVKNHGFISKKTEQGINLLEKLFSESHFLVVPSRAECYGVVYAEASSFGLPSLATNVGGISTAIHNGKNGWTFPLDTPPEEYCDYIENYMSSKTDYMELALSSFREYSERLNWSTAGRKVYELMQEFCN